MQAVDYATLLDSGELERAFASRASAARNVYASEEGAHFRSNNRGELVQDLVRLTDGAFLFSTDYLPECPRVVHRQLIQGSDWIHIQFRMKGGGHEYVSSNELIETPERSCILARYPRDSIIERSVEVADGWRVVCLFLNPSGIVRLLEVARSSLPDGISWITQAEDAIVRSALLPLNGPMMLAVNDILGCTFRGGVRRAYMRGKSLELLSHVIHSMTGDADTQVGIKLSDADRGKLLRARAIMDTQMDHQLTLAELARRVGLNRTKLAIGFKHCFGISVQAYWRDVRLNRARDMLLGGEIMVTEVAFSLGYSELSSFSRAFSRKFGVLPRDCKKSS